MKTHQRVIYFALTVALSLSANFVSAAHGQLVEKLEDIHREVTDAGGVSNWMKEKAEGLVEGITEQVIDALPYSDSIKDARDIYNVRTENESKIMNLVTDGIKNFDSTDPDTFGRRGFESGMDYLKDLGGTAKEMIERRGIWPFEKIDEIKESIESKENRLRHYGEHFMDVKEAFSERLEGIKDLLGQTAEDPLAEAIKSSDNSAQERQVAKYLNGLGEKMAATERGIDARLAEIQRWKEKEMAHLNRNTASLAAAWAANSAVNGSTNGISQGSDNGCQLALADINQHILYTNKYPGQMAVTTDGAKYDPKARLKQLQGWYNEKCIPTSGASSQWAKTQPAASIPTSVAMNSFHPKQSDGSSSLDPTGKPNGIPVDEYGRQCHTVRRLGNTKLMGDEYIKYDIRNGCSRTITVYFHFDDGTPHVMFIRPGASEDKLCNSTTGCNLTVTQVKW